MNMLAVQNFTGFRLLFACGALLAGSAVAQVPDAEDDFSSNGYAGGGGWIGDWTESGDDGLPGSGLISIVGSGAGAALRLEGDGSNNDFLRRQVDISTLSSNPGVLLSFDLETDNNLGAPDALGVYASGDGTTWNLVRQFNNDYNRSALLVDISTFVGSQLWVRFGIVSGTTVADDEYYQVDNIEIRSRPVRIAFATDELFGGDPLETATGGGTAQIFDAGNQPYGDDGVEIIVVPDSAAQGPLMIFDSETPSGGDSDLGTPNNSCGGPGVGGFGQRGGPGENCIPKRNSLIISEDGDTSDPDDSGIGGVITFTFHRPVDFSALKFVDDVGEVSTLTLNFSDGSSETLVFSNAVDLPGNGENGVHYASFFDFNRVTGVTSLDLDLSGSGSINALYITLPTIDFGDAPDSYGTDVTDDSGEGIGPSHEFDQDNPLLLGDGPDSEDDGQPSAGAVGDDAGDASPSNTGQYDDEEAVTFTPLASTSPGSTFTASVEVTNQSGMAATLCGWIDFNDDGDFDNNPASGGNNAERICVSVADGTLNQSVDLDFTVPDDFVVNGGADSQYYSRFRISADSGFIASPSALGPVDTGEVEDLAIPVGTLPVSISAFESRAAGGNLEVRWSTVSETRNAGFYLWADAGKGLELLVDEMIPSSGFDPLKPRDYVRTFPGIALADLSELAITAVDYSGAEEIYGLFKPGMRYGKSVQPAPIAWDRINQNATSRQRLHDANRARQPNANVQADKTEHSFKTPAAARFADLTVGAPGLHRVTWSDLADAGLDLNGVESASIAVTLNGKAIARHIVNRSAGAFGSLRASALHRSSHTPELFGPGVEILFWAETPDRKDKLYIQNHVYRVSVRPTDAVSAGVLRDRGRTGSSTYFARVVDEQDNAYHLASPLEDPWYAARLRADQNNSYTAKLHVDDQLVAGAPARLRVVVGGLTSFDMNPDHNIRVELNGTVLADVFFDGSTTETLTLDVPGGLLAPGSNSVRVVAPGGTDAPFDLSVVDTVTLEYPRLLKARQDRLLAENVQASGGFVADEFTTLDTVAYAWNGLQLIELNQLHFGRGSVRVPTLEQDGADYWISAVDKVAVPREIEVSDSADLLAGVSADFIIVGHPAFLPLSSTETHPLNDFIAQREADGWNIAVFDITRIQRQYGGGMPLPTALTAFLKDADRRLEYEHVLLVGADSYDYNDNLGLGSISFIPTMYAPTRFIPHTPSDGLLADLDGDGIADKAIGRWPVRSASDLEAIVTKTLDWGRDPEALANAVWVTDSQDPRQPSFRAQVDRMVQPLQSSGWLASEITAIHFEDVQPPPNVSQADAARAAFFAEIEERRSLLGFVGHGAPAMWTFQGLLTPDDLNELYNEGNPALIGTLTCYTTYFVSPFSDTVAHRWMNGYREDAAGEIIPGVPNGAVAVHGAATLSNYSQNEAVAKHVLQLQLDGATLGSAVLSARDFAADQGLDDQAVNWILLGDPTLRLD